jgi:secondary thiamine-phosphate synthase enzyme
MIQHFEIQLKPRPRGYHLITEEVLNHIPKFPETGLFSIYIKHTSAAIAINENADSSVLRDFESIMNQMVPENLPYLTHTIEGSDDMPAHIKAALIGTTVTIPILNGKLAFGTWQGIYLCEFRNRGGSRSLIASIYQ